MQISKWQLTAVFALAIAAHAQTSRGTVTGTALDASGAVISGAHVILTGIETGARRSTASNEAGIYRFDAVDLGSYELGVTHPGFRPYRSTGIGVEANRVTTYDPHLDVGAAEAAINVSGESSEMLIKDSPLRGGNFQPREVRDLPLISQDPLSLARTLPGVVQPSGSELWTSDFDGPLARASGFAVNGQRTRGNNYLLDGAENNDIMNTGVAQPFNIADAVEEVAAQTGNFGVEFGRAGGGVFNVVTKSGTNSFHGTVLWRYQSQRFNSVSNVEKVTGIPQSVFSNHVYGFTAGGPARRNKTFFFTGYQQNNRHATANFGKTFPTVEAVPRLRSLFPSNPRLDLYLGTLGDLRGAGAPFDLALGLDPQTGLDRGSAQFGSAGVVLPDVNDGPQWLVRLDHYQSEAHQLSWRYLYDSRIASPAIVSFPGFILDTAHQNHNVLFADSYTFGPSYTNEFRFSYGRLRADEGHFSPLSVPLARTLPSFSIANVSAPGILSNMLQFRNADNVLFQETQTKLSGRHAFRYGVELLRQIAEQAPGGNTLGQLRYRDSLGYSAFANFLDDFSGLSAQASRVFGNDVFHPNLFRQSYFFQDNWKVTPALAFTLGMRYEDFGQAANVMRYPAFSGFDPAMFLIRNEVNRDKNNFGPAFGLAWSPATLPGWLGKLFGDGKTVWRGGYQVTYDAFFTHFISRGLASSTPNAIDTLTTAPNTGRGLSNFSTQLPLSARAPSLLDAQTGAIEKDLRSPYTERWSFGFQRRLPDHILLDVSYVGSESHKLTTLAELNPLQPNRSRLYPDFGQRIVRTSQGNAAYHSLQWRADRRFARGFHLAASYAWSKMIDSTSEGVGGPTTQEPAGNFTSVPVALGGLRLDRGPSDYDRRQRLTLTYLWEVPGPRRGPWKYVFGGWLLAGIASFQSGAPFTIGNGGDRNSDGVLSDRADIGNPNAPLNTRAALAPATGPMRCASGYRDPDAGGCVNPTDAHWVEGLGSPNGSTVGRNTLQAGGVNNLDASLSKSIPVGERKRLEFRWEAVNAFNHPQFTAPPGQRAVSTGVAARFLNRDFTDSGIRSMWGQIKLIF